MTRSARTRSEALHEEGRTSPDLRDDPAVLEAHRPGSSASKDALVDRLSDKAAARLPKKRLRVYRLVQILLAPFARWLFHVEPIGMDKIPKRGPVLLVSNHVSWFDPIVVVATLKRPLSALAKSFLFKGWFRKWFWEELAGQIRVDRERRGNLAAVEAATGALRNGRLIGIWPEGGRSPTGHLTRGKTGVARIALASGAPVYPVAVLGTYELKPKHAKKINWGTPVKVICGEPLTFPDLVGKQDDREVTRAVTDRIMLEIAKLMGPDEEALYRELLKQDVPPGELPLDKLDETSPSA